MHTHTHTHTSGNISRKSCRRVLVREKTPRELCRNSWAKFTARARGSYPALVLAHCRHSRAPLQAELPRQLGPRALWTGSLQLRQRGGQPIRWPKRVQAPQGALLLVAVSNAGRQLRAHKLQSPEAQNSLSGRHLFDLLLLLLLWPQRSQSATEPPRLASAPRDILQGARFLFPATGRAIRYRARATNNDDDDDDERSRFGFPTRRGHSCAPGRTNVIRRGGCSRRKHRAI